MVTFNKAMEFVMAVKNKFQDKPEIYNGFIEAMKDYRSERLDIHGVITRIKELFKGHQELILGFRDFEPHSFKLQPSDEQPSQKKLIDFEEIVNKVKVRFEDNVLVYKSFLDILNHYIAETKSLTEVCFEVVDLFWEHLDLFLEFQNLCLNPNTSATS